MKTNPFPYKYIAIEGIIGAGKTTLTKKIANDFGSKLILEQFEENSFLPKFYKDPARYAFPLELSFLADRYQQLKSVLSKPDLFYPNTIADYFIFKSLIFAQNNLSDDEFILYSKLFTIIENTLPKPDLLVYLLLSPEKALQNIKKRGRDYEQDIKISYLQDIQENYLDYINKQNHLRVVIIKTSDLDFVNNSEDYEKILSIISKNYDKGVHTI